ncbi:amidohydrolase family protein [Micrococcus luteus]|nr:amidohydrolase family protein [Micrococcus luteus]MCV7656733.1 amidohydrolase family protein [Micrococcus luteus]
MTDLPADAIDAHAHVFEPGLATIRAARYVPDYAATLEQYLARLDEHGLERGVLVQPSFLGTDNSYLLTALAKEPERLRGVIVVDHDHPGVELTEGRVAKLHAAGVRGIRLNLLGRTVPDLKAPGWQEITARMARWGWHLEIQALGPQWLQLKPQLLALDCAVVVDHLGLPRAEHSDAVLAVLELAVHEHVWVKVSGHYRSPAGRAEAMLAALLERGTGHRLVFGSDWPHTRHEEHPYADVLDWARAQAGQDLLHGMLTVQPAELFGWPDHNRVTPTV